MLKNGIVREGLTRRVYYECPYAVHHSTGPFTLTEASVTYNWNWDPDDSE